MGSSQWEVRGLVYIPVIYFLTSYLFKDWKNWKGLPVLFSIGNLLLSGVVFLRLVLINGDLSSVDSPTVSLANRSFLSLSVLMLAAEFCFGAWKRHRLLGLIVLPPIVIALMVSNRRAVFLTLIFSIVILFAVLYVRKTRLSL